MRKLMTCTVLETGSGINFLSRNKLPRKSFHIWETLAPLVNDCSGHILKFESTTTIFVRFGTYVEKCKLFVHERFSTSHFRGGHFCDKFFISINPRELIVELDYEMKIPIIRKLPELDANSITAPENMKDSLHKGLKNIPQDTGLETVVL